MVRTALTGWSFRRYLDKSVGFSDAHDTQRSRAIPERVYGTGTTRNVPFVVLLAMICLVECGTHDRDRDGGAWRYLNPHRERYEFAEDLGEHGCGASSRRLRPRA